MAQLPDISSLNLNDGPDIRSTNASGEYLPDDIDKTDGNRYMEKLKNYAKALPYSIEPYSKMLEMLDFILHRLVQSVEARDYGVGFMQWDSMITYWLILKYPIPKDRLIALAKLYFQISLTPGLSTLIVATCADEFKELTESKNKITIDDMRLPWKPIYDILSQDLFLSRRQFEYSHLSWCMGYIAENSRKFFHPAAINEILSTFLPLLDGTKLDSVLSSQYYLTSFLPLSHPQYYLPMFFRVWESINSYMYDERMFHFISKLTVIHLDPEASDPIKIAELPDDERSEDEGRPNWYSDNDGHGTWQGLYKDVGIFTEHEWNLLMCKCLASMEIPLADGGSLTTGPTADSQAGFEISRLPKPLWRIPSLARIIVYSMAPDATPLPPSNALTPVFSPLPSGVNTPHSNDGKLGGGFLATPLGRQQGSKGYLAGCRALDSLARMIASTESFFHPSNSGSWTTDLSAFLKYIVYDFNKRWHEELSPDCKTPQNRRLTRSMKRELVKSLRTVVLLAMFSQDSTTVSNIQSCLKSMSVLEPALILYPVLERAVPSLEALVETQRTLAVIKALGAVAPAIVSRDVYYPGAKHLVPILQLLIPGIDLNDPAKTLCTTSFLVEISQYIKIGDLTSDEANSVRLDSEPTLPVGQSAQLPLFSIEELDDSYGDMATRLTDEEEDALLKDSTGSFPDWIASFIRRVIQLLENLPEEGPNGSAGGASEVQVIDAVTTACSQICIHLSEPLFDLVLNMVFDYASTNVRANAVRAIHQLVECVANADPVKTLAKFLPFCSKNIRTELENGASSLRTTSSSTPLPSDATLHWNLAILRGAVYNDGRAVLKYESELMSLIHLLHEKALSKRGYSWTGKLISSLLLTLTHTYPLENKFTNPDEWSSEEFRKNHHRHWGKLFSPEEIRVTWHVPNFQEIQFTLRIFKELVEPTLSSLESLLKPGIVRDAVWRGDFCRHLTLVRNVFAGTPTLLRESMTKADFFQSTATSDIIDEIPEMIASVEPINSGFVITDPEDPRYQYLLGVKHRFGRFLHSASVSLRQQGEENTVDAVQMLVKSVRTYMLEYGDSRDNYFNNQEQYTNDKSVARQYGGQKVWPRAVYIRRARYYNAARLRWNCIERKRGEIEDQLIDDLVEWSMWQYAVVRQSSQSNLEALCNVYDGVRRRALPVLFDALKSGTEDDRMKGALWTLDLSSFGKYAIAEPIYANDLLLGLFGCQHQEKPSIQDCVSTLFETCFDNFIEPSNIFYNVPTPGIDRAIKKLKSLLHVIVSPNENVEIRAREMRIKRTRIFDEAVETANRNLLEIGHSSRTHWRYAICAIRCLRTLVRRDIPLTKQQVVYFLEKAHDDHPSIRYYAQRAVIKGLRNIKLRTFCPDPVDLALARNHNPLIRRVAIQRSHQTTTTFLNKYKTPIDTKQAQSEPAFYDKDPPGWLVWQETVSLYLSPHSSKSTFQPWEASEDVIQAIREVTTAPEYWENLSTYYSEENHETYIAQDNVSCVKSIFQLLEDEPFAAFKPTVEGLIADKDQNKQRAAAEFLAGILGGSKHWPTDKQDGLWAWFTPHIPTILRQNIKTDTLTIWASFIGLMFYHKDPRRMQPLMDFLVDAFTQLDFNAELSFDAVKVISLFSAVFEGLGRKFFPWTDDMIERSWVEIHGEHDDVRAFVGEILAFSHNIKEEWEPKPSIPTAEVFVKECQILPMEYDIMGIRGTYHKKRVDELVDRFKEWRTARVSGVRAFQSTYDRVGLTVCKWLYQSLHDLHAISTFDYILPLMPELFRFTEVSDNNDLVTHASTLLVRMCGVTPPVPLVGPILDAIYAAITASPSWKVRLKALPLVQVFYFRHVPLISEVKIVEMLEVLCSCLDDEVVEVREMAATTLSGILRLSPRQSVITLKDRFLRLLDSSTIPGRQDSSYNKALRQRHAAILGICALVDSYPYTIEKWMPELLTNVLAEHTYDPIPISSTVRKCAGNFKRTHQDTWHEDCKRFNDDQLAALSTLLSGSSYCLS